MSSQKLKIAKIFLLSSKQFIFRTFEGISADFGEMPQLTDTEGFGHRMALFRSQLYRAQNFLAALLQMGDMEL